MTGLCFSLPASRTAYLGARRPVVFRGFAFTSGLPFLSLEAVLAQVQTYNRPKPATVSFFYLNSAISTVFRSVAGHSLLSDFSVRQLIRWRAFCLLAEVFNSLIP